jgi:hypothetical protein
MSLRETIATKAIEAGGRLTVRSALNPVLWLCAIVSVPCAVIMALMSSPPFILTFLAGAPVAAAVFGFFFLLVFDRDKLQSEDYQLRKSYLEMIEQKGDVEATDATAVEVVAATDVIMLPPEREAAQ